MIWLFKFLNASNDNNVSLFPLHFVNYSALGIIFFLLRRKLLLKKRFLIFWSIGDWWRHVHTNDIMLDWAIFLEMIAYFIKTHIHEATIETFCMKLPGWNFQLGIISNFSSENTDLIDFNNRCLIILSHHWIQTHN